MMFSLRTLCIGEIPNLLDRRDNIDIYLMECRCAKRGLDEQLA